MPDSPRKVPGGMVVLLEFSASNPSQSISHALTGALGGQTVEVDLIGPGYGLETDLDRRAERIAADVAALAPATVALAASCAASPILAPVALRLASTGTSVAVVAAVDPVPVTEGHIRHTLDEIAERFGIEQAAPAVRALPLDGPAGTVLDRIEALLVDWIERFLRSAGVDDEEAELVRADLLHRYLRWSAFLIAARDAPVRRPGTRVDLFLTDPNPDLTAVFEADAAVRRHRYPHRDGAALDRPDLVEDLRSVLSTAVDAD